MPEAGFEPIGYSIKWQRPTIRLLQGKRMRKNIRSPKASEDEVEANFSGE
jgi:hypothetical protein